MADPISPLSHLPDPPPDDGADRTGFEHLGWAPTWRDRVEAAVGGASPARLAGAVAVGVVALAVVAVVVLRGPAPPPPELSLPMAGGVGDPAVTSTTSSTVAPAADVVVHAAGAVVRPGVYRLAPGGRVADLLDAAGGAMPEADLDRLNLAAPLEDGQRVFVPVPGQDVPVVAAGASGPAGGGEATGGPPAEPLDLNVATAAELDTLPGVGPATASAILAERDRRGRFAAVEDLLDVRGIGEAKLAALRDLVRVAG